MQERLFNMLVQEDEITWQAIIYDLVKSEQMDPWDIDISLLSERYLETIRELEEHNFFISGKIILAAAILLKIKSEKLLNEYLANLDAVLFQHDQDLLEDENEPIKYGNEIIPNLLIKTPQARKRKINLDDLMGALNLALRVEQKRMIRKEKERVLRPAEIPIVKIDITKLIRNVYEKIVGWFRTEQCLTFNQLVGSERREDKILTFIPLLHLCNQQKIDLEQEEPFGEITVKLIK